MAGYDGSRKSQAIGEASIEKFVFFFRFGGEDAVERPDMIQMTHVIRITLYSPKSTKPTTRFEN